MLKNGSSRVWSRLFKLFAMGLLLPVAMSVATMRCAGAESQIGLPNDAAPAADWRGTPDQFSGRSAALRMFGGLFVCLGVFFVGVRFYRKVAGVAAIPSKRRIKIIERISLTQKGSIALISVDNQEFLVGMGSDAPRMLGRVSKSDTESFIEELSREDEMRVAV